MSGNLNTRNNQGGWAVPATSRVLGITATTDLADYPEARVVLVGNTAAINLTLPDVGHLAGESIFVRKISSDAYAVTVKDADGNTLTNVIDALNDRIVFTSDGGMWYFDITANVA